MTCPNDKFYQLQNFIRTGANDKAKSLLQEMEDSYDLVDASGSTLLHYSVTSRNVTMVQHLIELGYDINAQDSCEETPMMLAVKNKDSEIVEVLMKHNADIYLANRGMSSLKLAIHYRIAAPSFSDQDSIFNMFIDKINEDFLVDERRVTSSLLSDDDLLKFTVVVFGSAELARFVLKNGYAIDYREPNTNFTALHWTIIFGKFENAKLLIEHGASVDLATKYSPLYYYTEHFECLDEQSEVLKALIKTSWTDSRDRDNVEREIAVLLSRGNTATVRTTLVSGMVPMKFGSGRSLFSVMLDNESIDLVNLLSEFYISFDVDEYCDDRGTNLTRAVSSGSPKKVECLLKLGADVNLNSPDDETTLCCVFRKVMMTTTPDERRDLLKIVELLLQYGGNAQLVSHEFDDHEDTIIDRINLYFQIFPRDERLAEIIVAHVALLKALEHSLLTDLIRSKIKSEPTFERHFILCTKQLEEMKSIEVHDKVTLYEILTVDLEKLVTHARKQEFILAFNNIINTMETFEKYYINTLQLRIRKALDKVELDEKAVVAIEELTGLSGDTYYFVIYNIINFLSIQDLNNLCHINSIVLQLK